jgi:predicted methyltransferase
MFNHGDWIAVIGREGAMISRLTAMAVAFAISTAFATAATEKIPANIAAAVADPARPEADRARDANRKPAECLAFAGVKPGDRVADLIPGGGYFTRLFARAVGPNGYVYAYMPSDIDEIYKKHGIAVPPPANPNYPNVSYIHAPVAKFVTPEKLDIVWTSQNYHDLHDKFFGPADVPAVNKAVYDALKPGGVYVVLDHVAEAGSGLRDTDTLHRIDEATVKQEVEAAGFKLVAESNVLRNPADNHSLKVFDPSIRGKTDQFILKFRRPR